MKCYLLANGREPHEQFAPFLAAAGAQFLGGEGGVAFFQEDNADEEAGDGVGLPEAEEVVEAQSQEEGHGEKKTGQGLPGVGQEAAAVQSPAGAAFEIK